MSERRICKYCGMELSEDVPHGLRQCHLHAVTRIAELEAENDQLTAQWRQERQDDKCSKPEPNVCEACGGDGTVVLRDDYGGQVIATAKCTYCNGTGRVNKEREE